MSTSHHLHKRFVLPEKIIIDRHNTLVSYARSLRAHGKEYKEILEALYQANEQQCDPPIAEHRTKSEFHGITKWVCQFPPGTSRLPIAEEKQAVLEAALVRIQQFSWKGKMGQTCRQVAKEVLFLMETEGDTSISVSCRDIALILGKSFNTTARCLRLLCGVTKHPKYPILILFKRLLDQTIGYKEDNLTAYQHAYIYTIIENPHQEIKLAHIQAAPRTQLDMCAKSKLPMLHMSKAYTQNEDSYHIHDAFRGPRGLGITCAEVYMILEQNRAIRTVDVSQTIGMSQQTARNTLRKLQNVGLVHKQDGRWVVSHRKLDEVALARGSFGHYLLQRAEYVYQRSEYSDVLMSGKVGKHEWVWLKEVQREAPDPVW